MVHRECCFFSERQSRYWGEKAKRTSSTVPRLALVSAGVCKAAAVVVTVSGLESAVCWRSFTFAALLL